jgi:hypothetical protein
MGDEAYKFWQLKFSVEVSARYHDWRRATLESYVLVVRMVSAIGAVLSLIGITNPSYEIQIDTIRFTAIQLVVVAAALIGLVNVLDLVFGADRRAREHADLYRRFKELQAKIARSQKDWARHLADWEAEAQIIRVDEPPVMWAVYLMCWNQTVEKYNQDRKYMRKIGFWQKAFRNLFQFRPTSFPAAS